MTLVQQIKMRKEFQEWATLHGIAAKPKTPYGERVWRIWANAVFRAEGKPAPFNPWKP
jgi:hypothetical protein